MTEGMKSCSFTKLPGSRVLLVSTKVLCTDPKQVAALGRAVTSP